MLHRRAIAHLVLVAAGGVGVMACGGPAPERSAATFADRYSSVEQATFDGSSLVEIADRSDAVIVGALTSVVRGPDFVADGADPIAPIGASVLLTIENEDGLRRVMVPRRVTDDIAAMAAIAPIGSRVVAMVVPVVVPDGIVLEGAYADPDEVATMSVLTHPAGLVVAEDGRAVPLFGTSTVLRSGVDELRLLADLGLDVAAVGS